MNAVQREEKMQRILAKECDSMTPKERQFIVDDGNRRLRQGVKDMRRCFLANGLCPTPRGARLARQQRAYILKSTLEMVRKLEPADLFSVMLVVGKLAQWPSRK